MLTLGCESDKKYFREHQIKIKRFKDTFNKTVGVNIKETSNTIGYSTTTLGGKWLSLACASPAAV